jgi:hypothetical protein
MTADLTLERYPVSDAQDGFTITVFAAQAQAATQDAAQGQSVVSVQAGEQLTERQLLEALLIPSGNNIARMFAAAGEAAEQLVDSVSSGTRAHGRCVRPGERPKRNTGGHGHPLLPAPGRRSAQHRCRNHYPQENT